MSKLFDSRLADVIRKPVITEKATNALDLNQYTFEVDHRAAKPQIKAAIEALFSVKVIGVNTMNPPRTTLLVLLGGFIVLTPMTLTLNKASIAALICGFAAL